LGEPGSEIICSSGLFLRLALCGCGNTLREFEVSRKGLQLCHGWGSACAVVNVESCGCVHEGEIFFPLDCDVITICIIVDGIDMLWVFERVEFGLEG